MLLTFFFSKKFQHICVSLDVNFNESLTNDGVNFEQLGPDVSKAVPLLQLFVCMSVISYVAFVLSLFVLYLSFFWCIGTAMLSDCDISLISSPLFLTP